MGRKLELTLRPSHSKGKSKADAIDIDSNSSKGGSDSELVQRNEDDMDVDPKDNSNLKHEPGSKPELTFKSSDSKGKSKADAIDIDSNSSEGGNKDDMDVDPEDNTALKRKRDDKDAGSDDNWDDEHKKKKPKDSDLLECADKPPACAICRPELCGTINWFNAWQSVTHTSFEYGVLGYLIDRASGCRYIDEEIIILSVSGGFKPDARHPNGPYILSQNQTFENNHIIRAWTKNKDKGTPTGIIIGDQSSDLNVKLPHRFNVMDLFMITDIWQDKVNEYSGYSLRLQKVDLSKKSWWAPKGTPNPPSNEERDFSVRPVTKECRGTKKDPRGRDVDCGGRFPQVYQSGWMCLEGSCSEFWKIDGVEAAPRWQQQFDENFLAYREDWDVQSIVNKFKFDFIPRPDLTQENSQSRRDGLVCPLCDRCIPRVYQGRWVCDITWCTMGKVQPLRESEKGCTWQYTLATKTSVLDENQLQALNEASEAANEKFGRGADGYTRVRHELTSHGELLGTITHFVSNQDINAKPNGPDDLFERIQARCTPMGLRRHRALCPQIPGTMSNNFLKNLGLPYNFHVPNETQSFDEFDQANPGLMHSYARLDWAFREASEADNTEYHKPNEMLMIGYLEGQRINWHHDGAGKLGPQIATLCLGAQAQMSVRMKGDHYFGMNLQKNPVKSKDEVVLEGCLKEEKRRDLLDKYKNGQLDQKEYAAERRKLLKLRTKSNPPRIFNMKLHHGDIVVMDGELVQKYFEHTVESIPGVRFALTARHLLPKEKTVKEELQKWNVEVKAGDYTIKPDEVYNGN